MPHIHHHHHHHHHMYVCMYVVITGEKDVTVSAPHMRRLDLHRKEKLLKPESRAMGSSPHNGIYLVN